MQSSGGAAGFGGGPSGPFLHELLGVGPGAAVDLEGADVGEEFFGARAEKPLGAFAENPCDAEDKEEGEKKLAGALEERMHREH